MSPLEEYIAIIHNRQQNPLPKDEYKEEHHIIPQSLGGCNKKWNKVNLTPEEHYMAHYWLTFIYATGEEHEKMVYAWNNLSNRIKGDFISAEEYGRLKREFAKIHSKRMTGRPSPTKGVPNSEETRRKKSVAAAGKPKPWLRGRTPWNKGQKTGPLSEEHKKRLSEAGTGRHHTEEARRKISAKKTGVPKSEEHKRKISQSLTGHKESEETRRKKSESQLKNPTRFWLGKTQPASANEKRRQAMLRVWEKRRRQTA